MSAIRGIRVKTRSGRRGLNMCNGCYQEQEDDIDVAIDLGMVQRPVVITIFHCDICGRQCEVAELQET